jgi:hypothetical protein
VCSLPAAAQVREVQARLAGFLHRRALVREAQARFPGAAADASMTVLRGGAGGEGGAPVEVRLAQWWPVGDDVAVVEAAALRLEGRGFAAALDAAAKVPAA